MKKIVIPEEEIIEAGNDVYSEISREDLLENDELNPREAAFMRGYEEAI